MLQRAGLRDTCFIAMSNYYYDEKLQYLAALASAGERGHDLTSFLLFALKGLALQSGRLLAEIRLHVRAAVFRNTMYELFERLESPRKRVLAKRQIEILKVLLGQEPGRGLGLRATYNRVASRYAALKNPLKGLSRDLAGLLELGAIRVESSPDGGRELYVNLDWPREITETDFMERIKQLPKAKDRTL